MLRPCSRILSAGVMVGEGKGREKREGNGKGKGGGGKKIGRRAVP